MDSIELIHYRNYTEKTFDLGQWTIFVGPNGSGKTNVIEAIRTISVTKSYRVEQDKDAIKWGETYCRAILSRADETFEYVLTYDNQVARKVIKHNGVNVPFMDVYGLVPTVLFSPETMQLIDGAPQERRRFLDTLLGQVDKQYLEALMIYKKVLRERHFLLLRIQTGLGTSDELDYWDQELITRGEYLINARTNLLNDLTDMLKKIYPSFLEKGQKQILQLVYKPTSPAGELAKMLKSNRGIDIKSASTRVGPHRDELLFLLDDRDVTLFASRGELRRVILATKIAESEFLKTHQDKPPILLLDDVFSEFDDIRRSRLQEAIEGYQTIITTTDEAFTTTLQREGTVIHTLGRDS